MPEAPGRMLAKTSPSPRAQPSGSHDRQKQGCSLFKQRWHHKPRRLTFVNAWAGVGGGVAELHHSVLAKSPQTQKVLRSARVQGLRAVPDPAVLPQQRPGAQILRRRPRLAIFIQSAVRSLGRYGTSSIWCMQGALALVRTGQL